MMWSFRPNFGKKTQEMISAHDVWEPFKQALLASRDVIISSQICVLKFQRCFTLGVGSLYRGLGNLGMLRCRQCKNPGKSCILRRSQRSNPGSLSIVRCKAAHQKTGKSSIVQRKFLWVRRGCQASQRKGQTSGEVWETSGEVAEKLPGKWGLSRSSGEPDSLPVTRQICLQIVGFRQRRNPGNLSIVSCKAAQQSWKSSMVTCTQHRNPGNANYYHQNPGNDQTHARNSRRKALLTNDAHAKCLHSGRAYGEGPMQAEPTKSGLSGNLQIKSFADLPLLESQARGGHRKPQKAMDLRRKPKILVH